MTKRSDTLWESMIKGYNGGKTSGKISIMGCVGHGSYSSHPEAVRTSGLGCRVVCIDHPQIVPQDLLIGLLQTQRIGFRTTKVLSIL